MRLLPSAKRNASAELMPNVAAFAASSAIRAASPVFLARDVAGDTSRSAVMVATDSSNTVLNVGEVEPCGS